MNSRALASLIGTLGFFGLAAIAYLTIRGGFYAAGVSTLGVALFLASLRGERRREMASRALLCTFLMPIVAWTLTDVLLLNLVMCLWVPLLAGRFERIAGVYLLSILLLPGLDLPVQIGQLKLFDFGVQDALAVGAAIAVFCRPGERRIQATSDIWACVLLFTLGIALARETSATNFLRTSVNLLLDLGLPYYILSRGLQDGHSLRMAMRWFACGGMALACLLLFEAMRSWPVYNELYGRYGVPMVLFVKARGGILRPGGPFVEPTSIALVIALCLAAMWLLREDFRSKLHVAVLLAITFAGMSAPQSRGAWIGTVIGVIAIDIFRGRYLGLLKKGGWIVCTVALVVGAAKLSPNLAESVGLSSGGAANTVDYRRELLRRGVEELRKSPVIGYSVPRLKIRLADLTQGEGIIDFVNTYLWIALIGGVVGLMIFIGAIVDPLVRLWRRRRLLTDTAMMEPAAFAFASLTMLAGMLFFTSFGGRPAFLTFGIFGFSAAVFSTVRPMPRRRFGDYRAGGLPAGLSQQG